MNNNKKFTIQLVIGKMEFDGTEIATFNLMNYGEIVGIDKLESKLSEFYRKGLEKIKEIKGMIEN